MEKLQYPIGKFQYKDEYSNDELRGFIQDFETLPAELKKVTLSMTPAQLMSSYRTGGWTAAQVVHHVADSQINFYIRIKLALTENTPTIKPYIQEKWAELPESKSENISPSLAIIEGIHTKIAHLLKSIEEKEWDRKFYHPESKRYVKVNQLAALYSWHLRHHLEHIKMCAKS